MKSFRASSDEDETQPSAGEIFQEATLELTVIPPDSEAPLPAAARQISSSQSIKPKENLSRLFPDELRGSQASCSEHKKVAPLSPMDRLRRRLQSSSSTVSDSLNPMAVPENQMVDKRRQHGAVGYSAAVDVWSFGILCLELAYGKPPDFDLAPDMVVHNRATSSPFLPDFNSEHRMSFEFQDLVRSCLQKDPEKRPSVAQLLTHKFFKKARGPQYLKETLLEQLPGDYLGQNSSSVCDVSLVHNATRADTVSPRAFGSQDVSSRRGLRFQYEEHTNPPVFHLPHDSSHRSALARSKSESVTLESVSGQDREEKRADDRLTPIEEKEPLPRLTFTQSGDELRLSTISSPRTSLSKGE